MSKKRAGTTSVHVAVRVRPLSRKEQDAGDTVVLDRDTEAGVVTLEVAPDPRSHRSGGALNGDGAPSTKSFAFDTVFWSVGRDEPDYAGQADVFESLCPMFVDNALAGYNSSVFAYGQTGSGKTFSMMGSSLDRPDEVGLIPRACRTLFQRGEHAVASGAASKFTVEVSYLEIYLETIKDLLNPGGSGTAGTAGRGAGPGGALVVREHAKFGVFVPGLERLVASSYEDVLHFLDLGAKERTVAATKMNNSSSRSHAVFTLYLTLETTGKKKKKARRAGSDGSNGRDGSESDAYEFYSSDSETLASRAGAAASRDGLSGAPATLRAKVNLVDLAGSENQNNTGARGARLKEACAINKSLSALGNVISALTSSRARGGRRHIPYRDSVLTRLLQESLGGNAKAVMLVAVSPAASNRAQTLSTLSFAERAKRIVNKVTRNKTSNVDMVKALKAEIERLRDMLASGAETTRAPAVEELEHQVAEQQALIDELTVTLEERKERTTLVVSKREELLAEQGISLLQLGSVMGKQSVPYLVNLNPDPDLASSLVYYLRPGSSVVGSSSDEAEIVIGGLRIQRAHCIIHVGTDSRVTISPLADALTYINGRMVREPKTALANGCRLTFGKSVVFRFMSPLDPEPVQEFDWSDAVREMSMVLGLTPADFGVGGGGGAGGAAAAVPANAQSSLLADAAILADEGNDLARAMQKPVMFAVDLEPAASGDEDVISIRCTAMTTGQTIVVSIPEFQHRVDAMYQLYAEADLAGLGGPSGDPATADIELADDEDPFAIHAADELVGSAAVMLDKLLKGEPIDEVVDLDSEGADGSRAGRLRIRIAILEADTYKPVRPVRNFDKLRGSEVILVLEIIGAHGVESLARSGAFVRYSSLYPEESGLNVTNRAAGDSAAPEWNFKERYALTLDDVVYEAYRESPLKLELWGRPDNAETPFSLALAQAPAPAPSAVASPDDSAAEIERLQARIQELESQNSVLSTRVSDLSTKHTSNIRAIKQLKHELAIVGQDGPVELTASGASSGGGAGSEGGSDGGGSDGDETEKKKSRTCTIS